MYQAKISRSQVLTSTELKIVKTPANFEEGLIFIFYLSGDGYMILIQKSKTVSSVGLIINGPNVLLRKFNVSLESILNALEGFGRIIVGKVVLNHNASPKLVETVINYGLEPVIINGRVDVAIAVEAMKLIYNPKINTLALAVRDAHFLPLLFEAKRIGKETIIIAPEEGLSEALQNTADHIIKLKTKELS